MKTRKRHKSAFGDTGIYPIRPGSWGPLEEEYNP